MDVLDHSCSKLGFGGKMCIDGTLRYPEETDEAPPTGAAFGQSDCAFAGEKFPEIHGVNLRLPAMHIPCRSLP